VTPSEGISSPLASSFFSDLAAAGGGLVLHARRIIHRILNRLRPCLVNSLDLYRRVLNCRYECQCHSM